MCQERLNADKLKSDLQSSENNIAELKRKGDATLKKYENLETAHKETLRKLHELQQTHSKQLQSRATENSNKISSPSALKDNGQFIVILICD